MTGTDHTRGFTRRRLLAPGRRRGRATLSACGGGKSADEAAGGGTESDTKFTGKYTARPSTLAYWNGFTGGDGPFMDELVEKFQQENPKITVKPNTIEWADFYQQVPAAVTAGKGPDVGVMHQDQLATNAVRKVIVPVDDVAKALGLEESTSARRCGRRGSTRTSATASRSTCTRSRCTGAPTTPRRPASPRRRPTQASFDETMKKYQSGGVPQPFWMPSKWPSHLMFLSLLWQNGGEPYAQDGSKATFDSQAGVDALTWQVDQIKKGYSPKNVAQDTQYVGFKNDKLAVTWDGIWQINDLKGADVPVRHRADPDHRLPAGRVGELAPLLHQPAGDQGRQQVQRVPGVHRLDEQAVGRVGRRRA